MIMRFGAGCKRTRRGDTTFDKLLNQQDVSRQVAAKLVLQWRKIIMRTISALLVLQLFLAKNAEVCLRKDILFSKGERNLHQSSFHGCIEQENHGSD